MLYAQAEIPKEDIDLIKPVMKQKKYHIRFNLHTSSNEDSDWWIININGYPNTNI